MDSLYEASFYKTLDNNRVQCRLCSKFCKINENKYGICKSRFNKEGKLYLDNYPKIASFNIDPIEKKPFYHFLPGSSTFSIGGFGCNFSCLNCQNYMLATNSYKNMESIKITPETIVKNAIDSGCRSIAWTYNEASLYFEFAQETSFIAKDYDLKNLYISNGYMSNESLLETLKFIDAFNIDLKSFNDDFYKKICSGSLDVVLDNLKTIYKAKNKYGTHLEITTLLIDDLNTNKEELNAICDFIASELGKEVPIHFSRFFPMNKMNDKSPTAISTLELAKEIAIDNGLEYVYLGNVQTDKNSYCPNCGNLLISRLTYCTQDKKRIKDGHCINCGHELNFILE
ncbi:MAG: AmmeMemoRadiSam system radical SAM enzyme [archaeon]|nr:AmmeMemoRadiSam system radical SAM enzyme [archaeon]